MKPAEDEMIARFFAPLAGADGLGLRDDAALLSALPPNQRLVATKDVLIAGVHFLPDDPPGSIAAKAVRTNLSDLAAKAATPYGLLLGLALPPDWDEAWLAAFASGLKADIERFQCPLLGGDTTATPGPLTISITALGLVEEGGFVPRTGVKAGDRLFVTGTVGDAALGLRVLQANSDDGPWLDRLDRASRDALIARYRFPEPRLGLRDALRRQARAAMDVSDGFVGDLEKMLTLEELTAHVEAKNVPLSPAVHAALACEPGLLTVALTGGDDYELLCAVSPETVAAFESAAAQAGVPVAPVATAIPGRTRVVVHDLAGRPLDLQKSSFQHFT